MKKLIVTLLYCCLVLAAFTQPERRFQIWNKSEVVVQTWKNISIDAALKVHYSPENSAADLKYAELFLFHNPLKWFEYGAGFRVAKANLYPGWLQENRTMILANFKKNYKNYSFKYTNRFEYRSFENSFHHFRYKQDFKIEFPSLTNWGMRFYLDEETFYKLNGIGFHLARIYGGLSVVKKEHFNCKVYYALEKFKLPEDWLTTDIVGLNLSLLL